MSTMAASDADVKKSRSVSNSRMLLAKAPAEAGPDAILTVRICSKMRAEIFLSSSLPARSRK